MSDAQEPGVLHILSPAAEENSGLSKDVPCADVPRNARLRYVLCLDVAKITSPCFFQCAHCQNSIKDPLIEKKVKGSSRGR